MREPSLRTSRLALSGALVAALVVGAAGFMLGRETASPPPVVVPSPAVVIAAPEPVAAVPETPTVMDRRDLIALAATATDAKTSGKSLPANVIDVSGRRFDIRLPFGCNGPSLPDSEDPMRWRYDADKAVLRAHVTPTTWKPTDFLGAEVSDGVDTIEGFWISRPWTTSEACPPFNDRSIEPFGETVMPAGETLALAQVFAAGSGRQAQRGTRAFTVVKRMPEPPASLAQGLRLRLRGRVGDGLGAGPVLCSQPAGPQQRPICAISVELDEVSIEDAVGTVLETWAVGQPAVREN